MANPRQPVPSATGTLAERPLVHLLVYTRNKRLTGGLQLQGEAGSGNIYLWRGRIFGVRTVPPMAYFGAVAYEMGRIDEATLNATLLEISRTKRLHGEVLVERGALTPEQRDAILFEQTCRKVQHLFTLPPETTFAFFDARPTPDEPPNTVDPIAPVWRGLRERPPSENVREILRGVTGALKMVNEGPVSNAGFNAQERALCDALTARPMTLADMRGASSLSPQHVDLLAYLLVITKCAEPASTSSPAMAAVSPPTSPSLPPSMPASLPPSIPISKPSSLAPSIAPSAPPGSHPSSARPSFPPAPRMPGSIPPPPRPTPAPSRAPSAPPPMYSFRVPAGSASPPTRDSFPPIAPSRAPVVGPIELGAAGIAARAAAIESEDFFAALGLPDGASEEAARSAYYALAKVWHPDRVPPELAHTKPDVERVFNHLSRAHKMLTDRDARRFWLASRAAKAKTKRPRAEAMSAIESALAKKDFATMEDEARRLAEADPEEGEGQALQAWAVCRAGEGPEQTLRTALGLLDSAVNRDHQCSRAFFYRALVHKKLGNDKAALRDFQRVVTLDAAHVVEAKREVRILEMRLRK